MRRSSHQSLSLCPWVWHPKTRAHVRLLGPCFKTGRLKPSRQHPKRVCVAALLPTNVPTPLHAVTPSADRQSHFDQEHAAGLGPRRGKAPRSPYGPPWNRLPQHKPMLTRSLHKCTAGVPTVDCASHIANFNRFPFNGFTYCLTLFSKCFSSFPHGTCSLSVSCQYLALDEIYHPFWAAFPNNPTLRK